MVMLQLAVPGTQLGLYLTVTSPTRASVLAGLTPVVLITNARCTSATTVRELWKNKVYNSQVLRVHGMAKGHTARSLGRERGVGEREQGPGALLLLGLRMACLGFSGFTLCWRI